MSASAYAEHLKQALLHGLEINPKLERRQVSGVWGMYATEDIAQGELIARFPESSLVQPDASAYGAQFSPSMRMIHAAVKERQKGAASPFAYLFDMHESLAQMQGYSTYFYGDAELAQIRSMSSHLADVILYENQRWRAVIQTLLEFDDSLDEDLVIATLLNFSSRAISSDGFVPVLDCFNHSSTRGSIISGVGGDVTFIARETYPAGAQVYVFYGWRDLYDHAIFYNYYDAADEHFIRFGRREFIPLQSEQAQKAYRYFSQKYGTQTGAIGGQQFFCFKDDDALLRSIGPTPRLQQLLADYGRLANDSRTERAVMLDALRSWLDGLERSNHVEKCRRKDFPVSMRRFHDVLSKELQLVRQGQQWLATVS